MCDHTAPCTDARRTETTCVTPACVAPRHVDAPRDFLIFYFFYFIIFSPNEQRAGGGGGGGALPDFFFSFFPCSADHERDWPPCKVVFFGLATNTLNVRNNNNKNNCCTITLIAMQGHQTKPRQET